jgi:signal transduction histidine kinase
MQKNSILFLVIIWTVLIGFSFAWNRHMIVQNNHDLALYKSQSFFNQILITRFWNSAHGGVYVPVTELTEPNPYLKDSLRDLTATNGMKLTKVNPAFMTRQISELNHKKDDIRFHITSLKPLRPANDADLWEKSVLARFEAGEKEVFELINHQDRNEFRYMAPLKVEESCLTCHAEQGYKLGEVRGGISVSFPSEIYTASQNNAIVYILFIHIAAYILGLSGLMAYNRMSGRLYSIIAEKNIHLEKDRILLKDTNAALSKTLAEKDKFFSIIAHDLKSPFYGLIGLSDMLTENINNEKYEDIKKYAGYISRNVRKTYDLTVNLLEWSQAQTGGMAFNPETFDINLLTKEITEFFYSAAHQKEISIIKEMSGQARVFADRAMISAAIRNLISNALKFTGRGGKIVVSVLQKDKEILISVKDNGIGMSKKTLQDLFQIDKEVSRPGTEDEPSTGLGLILCKEFVEKNSGKIQVESKENLGSTFSFSLPAVKT